MRNLYDKISCCEVLRGAPTTGGMFHKDYSLTAEMTGLEMVVE